MEMENKANKFFKLNEIIKNVHLHAVETYLHNECIHLNDLKCLQLDPACNLELHSPVCVASKYDLVDIVEVLISHGFDPEECDLMCQLNPLQTACNNGAVKVVMFLLHDCKVKVFPNGCSVSPLTLATRTGSVEIVMLLLAAGAQVNCCQPQEEPSVLHIAAASNLTKLCQILISSGAALEAVDQDKATPLQSAVANGHAVPVCLLLASGANVNGSPESKTTPLITSIGTKRMDLVKILCCSGADPDLPDVYGHTPLRHATFIGTGNYEILRYLIVEQCACMEPTGGSQDRSLSTSIRNLDPGAVRLLVGAGYLSARELITYDGSLSNCVLMTTGEVDVTRFVYSPRSLRETCCLRIRAAMGRQRLDALQTLCLPPILKDLIALKHL